MNAPLKINAAPVRKSILVNAPQARAFQVFTTHFASWWPKSHHIGAAEMAEAVIEPHLGGRWYEKSVDGSECQWGEVLAWEPPSRVVLSWRINGQFKLDMSLDSSVEVRFIAQDRNTTLVELEHRVCAVD